MHLGLCYSTLTIDFEPDELVLLLPSDEIIGKQGWLNTFLFLKLMKLYWHFLVWARNNRAGSFIRKMSATCRRGLKQLKNQFVMYTPEKTRILSLNSVRNSSEKNTWKETRALLPHIANKHQQNKKEACITICHRSQHVFRPNQIYY